MSYIVIRNPKLIIQIDKDVDYLEEDEECALDEIVENTSDYIEKSAADTKFINLTVREVHALFVAHNIVCRIIGLDADKLLIYWMTAKNIDFEIEDHIDVEEFKNDGYNIIRFEAEE